MGVILMTVIFGVIGISVAIRFRRDMPWMVFFIPPMLLLGLMFGIIFFDVPAIPDDSRVELVNETAYEIVLVNELIPEAKDNAYIFVKDGEQYVYVRSGLQIETQKLDSYETIAEGPAQKIVQTYRYKDTFWRVVMLHSSSSYSTYYIPLGSNIISFDDGIVL